MDRSEVGIIIPAHNEEKTIGKVVQATMPYGISIVVDDCSKDKTSEFALNEGATVVKLLVNKGYDGALESGFKKAQELGLKYVITFDADGQHDASLLREYISLLHKEKKTLVLGVRPSKPRISEKIIGLYFSWRFGIHDILCGMKGYHLNLYNEHGAFDTIGSIGSELTMASIKRGYSFTEIDVPISPREDQPRFGNLIKSNFRIFRALFKVIMMDIAKNK